MEGARVEEVPEQHRHLVVPATIDARHPAALVCAVEHVVVDERRQMNQLDNRGHHRQVPPLGRPGRPAVGTQEDQPAAQLLAAEAADVRGHVGDRGDVRGQRVGDHLSHGCEVIGDRGHEGLKLGVLGTHDGVDVQGTSGS